MLFLTCFSNAEIELFNRKVQNFFDQFGINIPCSATYLLEEGARVSMIVVTKSFLRGIKSLKI